jgi:protein SCO1/2
MIGRLWCTVAVLLGAACLPAAQRYPVTGLIIKIDPAQRSFVASCTAIPGYMEAMVMPFTVRDNKQLKGIAPSTLVDFTLVVNGQDSYAENVRVHHYFSAEQEPVEVRNLQLLSGPADPAAGQPGLALGDIVQDFTLTDQAHQQISLSQFAGKVVVAAFVYTSCPLPNYCFRLSNNLGHLQKRFSDRLGRELIFLSVTMDPVHDTPEVLAKYAATWKADARSWHFLTGPRKEVGDLCHRFGVEFWQGEGSLTHSLHTIVISREQKLAANFEGNDFTAEQLGDFVDAALAGPDGAARQVRQGK